MCKTIIPSQVFCTYVLHTGLEKPKFVGDIINTGGSFQRQCKCMGFL